MVRLNNTKQKQLVDRMTSVFLAERIAALVQPRYLWMGTVNMQNELVFIESLIAGLMKL